MNIITYNIVDIMSGTPFPKEQFFMDVNIWDITETVIKAINNLPEQCIGISIRHDVGRTTREAVRRIGKETGLLIQFTLLYKGIRW